MRTGKGQKWADSRGEIWEEKKHTSRERLWETSRRRARTTKINLDKNKKYDNLWTNSQTESEEERTYKIFSVSMSTKYVIASSDHS